MKKILLLLLVSFILASCRDLLHIEKRKYLPGYFIDLASKKSDKALTAKTQEEKYATSPEKITTDNKSEQDQQINSFTRCETLAVSCNGKKTSNFKIIFTKSQNTDTQALSSRISINKQTNKTAESNDLPSVKETSAKTKNRNTNDSFFLLLAGLFCALTATAFQVLFSRPTNMVYWASKNRMKTIAIISVLRLFIGALGMFVGKNLYDMGIITSEISTCALYVLAAAAALLYPGKNKEKNIFPSFLKKQNVFGILLTIAGFLLMANISNRTCLDKTFSPVTKMAIHGFDRIENVSPDNVAQETLSNNISKETKPGNIVPVLLTILAVILFLAIMALVMALSCGLICNGQEALAALVLIVGIPSGIILFIQLIRAIWKPKSKVQPA
jgi:hypothetical protein